MQKNLLIDWSIDWLFFFIFIYKTKSTGRLDSHHNHHTMTERKTWSTEEDNFIRLKVE